MKHLAEQFELPITDCIELAPLNRPLTYLACPYSSPDDSVRRQRFEQVTKAAAWLIKTHGLNVFSPITHSHPLHELGALDGSWDFWKRIDTEFLDCSCRMIVLALPGWRDSVGVQAEIKIAQEQKIPVVYLAPYGVEFVFVREQDAI